MHTTIFSMLTLSATSCFTLANTYQTLVLPKEIIRLDSNKGQICFKNSQNKQAYWKLSEHFVGEANGTYCAIASAVMLLNALGIDPPQDPDHPGFYQWTQKNIFNQQVKHVIPIKQLKEYGLGLRQEAMLLAQFPLEVNYYYGHDIELNAFRQLAIQAVSSHNKGIIIHFSRSSLHEVGNGHFSPLAAYDASSDRFLVMDVAPYKYPPVWIKTKDLWKAMRAGGNHRGFIVATNPKIK